MAYIGARPGQGKAQEFRYVATQQQTVFSGLDSRGLMLSYTPGLGSTCVFVNGTLISPFDEYTALDGSALTVAKPLQAGDEITILAFNTFTLANVYSKPEADLRTPKRNRVLNPAMNIAQQIPNMAAVAWGAAATHHVDGWWGAATSDGAVTGAQIWAGGTGHTPGGSLNKFRSTVTTADAAIAANQFACIVQQIEGYEVSDFRWGTTVADAAICRMGVRSSVPGTYSVSFRNHTLDRSYVTSFTIAAGEVNTDLLRTFVVPGDLGGTWERGTLVGVSVGVCLASGTNFQTAGNAWVAGNFLAVPGQVNWLGTVGATFDIFDVGLYRGTELPPFEVPSFQDELLRCQRYYEKSYDTSVLPGAAGVHNGAYQHRAGTPHNELHVVEFKAHKRLTPTITIYSPQTGASALGYRYDTPSDVTASLSTTGIHNFVASIATAQDHAAFGFHWVASARF